MLPPMVSLLAIVGVVGLVAVGVLILVLSARNEVTVMDVKPPPPEQPPAEKPASVLELLRAGRKIEAIKAYRESTGVGLKEAKDAVEAMERGEPVEPPPMPASKRHITGEMAVDDAELRGHVSAGRLIDAIKRYRELTGLGLKESKDAIEALRDSLKS